MGWAVLMPSKDGVEVSDQLSDRKFYVGGGGGEGV